MGGLFGKGGGGSRGQAGAAIAAAKIAADAQREQLDYLKEVEAVPQYYRQGAIRQLAALTGLGGEGPVQGNDVPAQVGRRFSTPGKLADL